MQYEISLNDSLFYFIHNKDKEWPFPCIIEKQTMMNYFKL